MPKGRILVVDDLPDWRTTLSGILFDEGYDVQVASSREEALNLMTAERFHIAILDVRLNEADEDNREGLELMRQIRAYDPTTFVIILTGYADVAMVQEALRPQRDGVSLAYSFVEKSNVPELIEFVDDAFQRELRINWKLDIQRKSKFLRRIPAKLRFTDHSKPPPDQLHEEIDELLRKLFFNCNSVTLQPLKQGFSGAAVFRVEPHYQGRGRGESVVVKLGEWSMIMEEERNFNEAVQGIVGGHRLPQRLELARTRSLGGLIYTFAGLGEAIDFVDFYLKTSPPKIIPVLENLFLETCFPWGRDHTSVQPSFSFTDHYFAHLHLSESKLKHSLASLFSKRQCVSPVKNSPSEFRFFEKVLVNPVDFVLKQQIAGEAYLVPVHGDLTGYNIFLDRHLETWLIDFGRTGQGLLLQDFTSLENFVKISLLESSDPNLFYNWEINLANSPTLQPTQKLLEMTIPSDNFTKAHQVIMGIRQLAYQIAGEEQFFEEYLIDLLFHALKLVTIRNLKPIQRVLALVSAALICERLMLDNKIHTN